MFSLFSLPEFVEEIQENVKPILNAYIKVNANPISFMPYYCSDSWYGIIYGVCTSLHLDIKPSLIHREILKLWTSIAAKKSLKGAKPSMLRTRAMVFFSKTRYPMFFSENNLNCVCLFRVYLFCSISTCDFSMNLLYSQQLALVVRVSLCFLN